MPKHDPIPRRPPGGVATPHAWARYRRIMRWMTGFAVLCAAAVLLYLRWDGGPTPLPMMIAVGIGVFLTVLVGTALMSLAFLSSGSGHDEAVFEPFEEDR